ncbi:sugar transport protein MST8-like [Papaver somniferum]|uniref:sugar transport protein MST8-like n=1 Tax=Papaver somniferum TaxID=3469 RepID=UPI000E705ED0|nr:sugar transport protein MST8-like [Papaver somniferum]
MSMRHKNGTGTPPPPPTELPSTESKMRMNVEKSNENKKISLSFLMACFIGINSGFLIGYMTGIIGGLMFGTGFVNHFYPSDDAFTYSDIVLYSMLMSFFPAILYISGSIGIDIRKRDFSRLDMRRHMILSGALVSMGSVVTIFNAVPIIFILGPNLFAMGFGMMYQGAQVYMSEMGFAHKNYLASLNIAFKMMIAIGIFVANIVNCCTNSIKGGWGWEVSIGIAAIPAAIISIGSFLLPDTPMSMIKLGKFDDAKQLLQRLHGTNDDVYILFKELLATNEASKSAKGCEKQIMSQTQNTPYRVMAIALSLFQQLTGMNVIVMYAPYLFQVIGFQESAALTYTAIIGGVNVAATIIGIISARQGCRRVFLIAGGVQICVGQILLGILIWIKLGGATGPSDVYDYLIISTTCVCV